MKTSTMIKSADYHAQISVAVPVHDVIEKIGNVSEWWAHQVEGPSKKLKDRFTVRIGETFVDFEIVELVPEKKLVWLVTDCNLHWIKNKKEWTNTKVVFEIGQEKGITQLDMRHIGLVPGIECYENCEKGWDFYIKKSLFNYLTTGKGLPETPMAAR